MLGGPGGGNGAGFGDVGFCDVVAMQFVLLKRSRK